MDITLDMDYNIRKLSKSNEQKNPIVIFNQMV
jgi:hypothetical protein